MAAAAPISRRAMLTWCGAGALAVVTGCSTERTGDETTLTPEPTSPEPSPTGEAPAPTGPETSGEVADAAVLLTALERSRRLTAQASAIEGAGGRRARALRMAVTAFQEQVRVLERLLEVSGIDPPPDTATATSSPNRPGDERERTATAAPPGAGSTRRQLDALAREAAKDVQPSVLTSLATVSEDNLPMLIAIAGQRGGLAMQLGHDPGWAPLAGPTGADAAAILEVLEPAIYAFEVLAARTSEGDQERYEQTLQPLDHLARSLTGLAGEDAAPAPLGYGIPDELGSAAARLDLAQGVLRPLCPSIMQEAAARAGDPDAVAGTARLIAEVGALGLQWRLPLTGFPGMQVPEQG